jgi:uncharacterized protein YndB with AHSA1/START domain
MDILTIYCHYFGGARSILVRRIFGGGLLAEYRFLTWWQIEAPLQAVFDTVLHSEHWPQWWHGVREVRQLAPGDARGIGSVRRYVWQSPMLYRITFDAYTETIEQPDSIEARIQARIQARVSGDLDGSGCWNFSHHAGITTVRYDWQVQAARRWMRISAGLLRGPFRLNHRILMQRGAVGLARRLAAPLIQVKSIECNSTLETAGTTALRSGQDDSR